MKISLLIIATEILEGKIQDKNGTYLSSFLKNYHLELFSTLVVRDDVEQIKKSIETLFNQNDVLIISGGLGPTKDDLTKLALAHFLKKEILFSEESLQVAKENYARMNRDFPGKDHPYSFIPETCRALSNLNGFAPGIFFENSEKIILCAPGVPREFEAMLGEHLSKWIHQKNQNTMFMENMVFRTKKIPEEKIFNELEPQLWDKLSAFGEVSSLPVLMGVDIGVKIKATSTKELENKKHQVKKILHDSCLKSNIWSYDYSSLEEKIVNIANEKKITFSFAESCTGGLCSHRITNIPGSSQTFLGSIICYDESVKVQLLEVCKKTLQHHGVVSLKTAEEMATGVAQKLNTQIGISLTGFAGPTGGTPEDPIGTVCIGIYSNKKIKSERFNFVGNRSILKERFSQAALFILLEVLESAP